jgi:hypothetical protein
MIIAQKALMLSRLELSSQSEHQDPTRRQGGLDICKGGGQKKGAFLVIRIFFWRAAKGAIC